MKRHLTLSAVFAATLLCQAPLEAAAYQIGLNFQGSKYGADTLGTPADGNGAIGPNHFVEFINGRFAIYSKKTGARVATYSDVSFFSRAGMTIPSGFSLSDPRVIYDVTSGRWFATMVDFKLTTSGTLAANQFVIAVSATDDPTGAWKGFLLTPDTSTSYAADFPTLGVDANGLYISGFMFDTAGAVKGTVIDAIPKASLLQATPTSSGVRRSGVTSFTTRGYIVQPAVTTGTPTTPEVMLAVSSLGTDFVSHNTVKFSETIAGTLAMGGVTTITVPAYNVPINPTQPNGFDGLDDGDSRFSGMVRRVGDIVYAVHAVDTTPSAPVHHAGLQWFKFDAVNKTLIDSGVLTDLATEYFFPSIAANENGDVVIGCNGCGLTTYISSFAFIGEVVDGKLAFSDAKLLASGLDSYQTPNNPDPTDRWGDYSATSPDPNDPSSFWTIQMIPLSNEVWATQITQLFVGFPKLTAQFDGANLILSWPDRIGVHLENSPDLSAGSWSVDFNSPTVANGVATVSVPATSGNLFFRLAGD